MREKRDRTIKENTIHKADDWEVKWCYNYVKDRLEK